MEQDTRLVYQRLAQRASVCDTVNYDPQEISPTPQLVIFCGLQATGKSTFYRLRFEATHALVSKDLMPNNRQRTARQLALVAAALAQRQSVVVDNTNPQLADRAPLIALGKQHGARILGYWFGAEVAPSLSRNREREGKARVPDIAIYTTRKRLLAPAYAEGFDMLYTVRIVGAGVFAVELMPGPPSAERAEN